MQVSKGPCNNWLVAVRTFKTDVSMDISELFSLWKGQAKCESMRRQNNLSMSNVAFQTGYKLFSQHKLDTESPSCLVMLALWDTFATDIAILSSVKQSWVGPQGDEHQRCFLECLKKCSQGCTLIGCMNKSLI